MLDLKNISKKYNQKHGVVHALSDVNLTVEKGTFITITGSSGSGKSTLLLLLGGLIKPSGGTIKFSGDELYSLSPKKIAEYRNRRVGFVLQTFHLIPYLTALENVEVPMMLGKTDPEKQKERAESLLAKLGLSDRKEHLPRELSVGQQQRVAIARALANDPEIILADDEGRTVIMVTHSPEASKFGSLNLKIENGKILT